MGLLRELGKRCVCMASMVSKYQKRISGPILDCIDIHFGVPRLLVQKLAILDGGESSTVIRQRVEAAKSTQQARFAPLNKANLLVNADMGPVEVQKFCHVDPQGMAMIRMAVEQVGLRVCAYHRSI